MNRVQQKSPCIKICKMNPKSGLCEGCFRTLEEISKWSQLSYLDKQKIYQAIRERKNRTYQTD